MHDGLVYFLVTITVINVVVTALVLWRSRDNPLTETVQDMATTLADLASSAMNAALTSQSEQVDRITAERGEAVERADEAPVRYGSRPEPITGRVNVYSGNVDGGMGP